MSEKLYFIYARVSDTRYLDSIKTQISVLKGIADAKQNQFKYTDKTIITEHRSGSKGERPEFAKMVKILQEDSLVEPASERKYAGVLFYKIDRLFRNFHDFHEVEKLMKEGYKFISGTETIENTPTGRLLFRMLAGFAIYESEKLSNRESLTYLMNALKNRFESLGGKRPFGYRVVVRNDEKTGSKGRFIEKSPEESRLIFLIYTLRSDNPKISPKQILDKIMEFPDSWNTLKELIETRDKKKTESKIETLKKIQKLKKMSLSSDEDDSIDNTELEIEGLDINQLSQAKTPEEKAIKIIDACLRNESGYKYNGLITRTFQINDELIQNFLKGIASSDDDKLAQEYGDGQVEWEKDDISIGKDITFTFYMPGLAIIDEIKYQKVQESFKKREQKEEKKEDGIMEGILYLRTPNGGLELMNTYQSAKKTVGYRRQFNKKSVEKSELSIENAIQKSHLFDNHENIKQYHDEILDYLEVENRSILKKQIRAERAKKMVYNFQMQNCKEVMIELTKDANPKENKQLFGMIQHEISYYSDLRREAENNIDQLEKNGREMISFFFHLLTGDINNLDKSERKLAYLAMFEYIEMSVDKKTLTIHLRQFMAQILGVPKAYPIQLM